MTIVATLVAAAVLCSVTAAGDDAAAPSGSLVTAVVDQGAFSGRDSVAAFREAKETGAGAVRLILNWKDVAPATPTTAFQPADPGDPQYNWSDFDKQVGEATAAGLQPIVDVFDAPTWATAGPSAGGPLKPSPLKLATFANAAAVRYGGGYESLPRVKYWELWDEPNLAWLLRPQFVGKRLVSPTTYRGMVNAFADAVHRVHPDNSVIAGGTAPFTTRAGKPSSWGPGPLLFMRDLLCLSADLKPTCNDPVKFDIWSHHPYTSGGPSHHAVDPDDVSLGDLPKMRAVLDAAIRLHHIESTQKVRFWVDEFSWDTDPPDPNAMPIKLQTRWVSEALYTMWKSGISLVTWYSLRDQPLSSSPYQSGLFFVSGRAKPSLTAFRFPFVALPENGAVRVWGRTPWGKRGAVEIEQRHGSAWLVLGRLSSSANGLFGGLLTPRSSGPLRARLEGAGGEASEPYSLTEPPDRNIRPFGEAK